MSPVVDLAAMCSCFVFLPDVKMGAGVCVLMALE
jgi:hypothetical protein